MNILSVIVAFSCSLPLSAVSNSIGPGEAEYLKGIESLSSKDYTKAISHCEKGIEELGDLYLGKYLVEDDSHIKLVLAKSKYDDRDFNSSANLYCHTLESRISIFKNNVKNKSF